MRSIFPVIVAALLALTGAAAMAADDVLDAIEQGRKAYQSGDLAVAKQSLDLASQLIGQKNAESFGKLMPAALPGWTAEEVQTTSLGAVGFGASSASRNYRNGKGNNVEVRITGDSAAIMQFATVLANPAIAGAVGKIVMIGDQRAIQSSDGDVHIVMNNKFLVMVSGSGSANDKMAYARAIDLAKLSKM